MTPPKETIGIIGLGYVGLPLACLFSPTHRVVGFDTNRRRVGEILAGNDSTREVSPEALRAALDGGLTVSDDPATLRSCTFYIVAVPTPVNGHHEPDLRPLAEASRTIGSVISRGDAVVFESTVYPGTTEEYCLPIIERESGLRRDTDFDAGYSPERVNPGDRVHTVARIVKIVSGSTPQAAERIRGVYASVLEAATYLAPSIKVAEAAKIIENTQRDVNIAFVNEVAKVFNALGIDTGEVLRAASTKWNFLPFRPGLVGGHCIGVDPYYLIRKAELHGIHPRLMTEARSVNESMGYYLADRVVEMLNYRNRRVKGARILIMGFAFKEDCPDIRNTKTYDTVNGLTRYGAEVTVFDPVVDAGHVAAEYPGVPLVSDFKEIRQMGAFEVIVWCVRHTCFDGMDLTQVKGEGCFETGIVSPDKGEHKGQCNGLDKSFEKDKRMERKKKGSPCDGTPPEEPGA